MNVSQEPVTLGLTALTWLVAQEDLLPSFLGSTGVDEADLRNRASDPAFLGGVLDFIMMNDTWVMKFCDSVNLPYEQLQVARQRLPGGEQVHWT